MSLPEFRPLAVRSTEQRRVERPPTTATKNGATKNGVAKNGVGLIHAGTPLAPVPDLRPSPPPPPVVPVRTLAPTAVEFSSLRYHGWQRRLKRLIDVVVTLACMPFALPVMAVAALVVRCTSRGPALFRQERVGQFGEMFSVLKLRTMYVDADQRLRTDPRLFAEYVANDFKLGADVDPRLTRVGRFMRMSSLDELPQLFNVLAGSMSLVGPRPIVRDELGHYGDAVASYLQMRPGITGRWQVDGRNLVRYPERAYLDHDYLMSWRLRTDVAILARTLPSILRRRGCR